MKSKFTFLLSVSCLLQSFCFSQNAAPISLPQNMPRFVKELAKGAPPELLLQTDPGFYNYLQKRRMVFTGLLYKEVQAGRLPDSFLRILNKSEVITPQSNKAQSLIYADGAGSFKLTKDVNAATNSYPYNYNRNMNPSFAAIGNTVYFSANDGIHGAELWCSNGTESGTRLVKDIFPGISSSDPRDITVYKNKLYFSAYDSTYGTELFQSDGTEAGTQILKDVYPGSFGSYPNFFTVSGNTLYFMASGGTSYRNQIWKTNGTAGGTQLVKDIYLSDTANEIAQLTSANGILFFTAYTYRYGQELWTSNGTLAGTFMLKNINPYDDFSPNYHSPSNLTEFNNKLYFVGYNGTSTLWESDGTNAGTWQVFNSNGITVNNFYYSYSDQPLAIADSAIYFSGYSPSTGNELYKYKIKTGITLVKDIAPGATSSGIVNEGIRSLNNKVYFSLWDGNESSLWQSNGTAAQTVKVTSLPNQINYTNFYSLGSNLYFSLYDTIAGNEPWISDGTASGTKRLKDVNTGVNGSAPVNFSIAGNKVYFSAYTKSSGVELWQTKGTDPTTLFVKDINTSTTDNGLLDYSYHFYSDYSPAIALTNNKIVFNGYNRETGAEVWVSNGSGSGTTLVKDLFPNEASTYPEFYTAKNGKAYFTGSSPTNYTNIFITDGTAAGTKKIVSISDAMIEDIQVTDNGNIFYILYNYITSQTELWKANEKGIAILLKTDCGYNIAAAGNICFFTPYDVNYGYELWKSNGSATGTRLVKDILKGSGSSNPQKLTPLNNKVIFTAYSSNSAFSTWASDGTGAGTFSINDSYSYLSSSTAVAGNYLYYISNGDYGSEVYKTDGTVSGSSLVKDIYPGYGGSDPANLTAVNDTVYFFATDGTYPYMLWKTSGTTIKLVKIFDPNTYHGVYISVGADGKFYFLNGAELWYSEGTNSTTKAVGGSVINSIQHYGYLLGTTSSLFFAGTNPTYGYELYAGSDNTNKLLAPQAVKSMTLVNAHLSATLLANPFINNIVININSEKAQHLQVNIYDASGKKALSKSTDIPAGSSNTNLSASQLARGVYTVSISNGTETINLKAIK